MATMVSKIIHAIYESDHVFTPANPERDHKLKVVHQYATYKA